MVHFVPVRGEAEPPLPLVGDPLARALRAGAAKGGPARVPANPSTEARLTTNNHRRE